MKQQGRIRGVLTRVDAHTGIVVSARATVAEDGSMVAWIRLGAAWVPIATYDPHGEVLLPSVASCALVGVDVDHLEDLVAREIQASHGDGPGLIRLAMIARNACRPVLAKREAFAGGAPSNLQLWEKARDLQTTLEGVDVLYAEPTGPYMTMATNVWTAADDAAKYDLDANDHPIVAHPPCGPWGRFAWKCTKQDASLGPIAVAQVRAKGGVLEHPKGSALWAACGLPLPNEPADRFGGFTVETRQWDHGHEALKPSWFYCVGPEHVVRARLGLFRRGGDTPDTSRRGSVVINRCARKRRLTPHPLAWWLLATALECRGAGVGSGCVADAALIREAMGWTGVDDAGDFQRVKDLDLAALAKVMA